MKTRRQILEIIHDSVLEDKTRHEIAIKMLDDKSDDYVLGRRRVLDEERSKLIGRPSFKNEIETKKDTVLRYQRHISERKKSLKIIKKLLNEENGKRN